MVREEIVRIAAGGVTVEGMLALPDGATGMVLFAHGSGSSRHSPRNGYVAARLHEAGIATLLPDLLTEEEDCARANRFDIALLAERLGVAAGWLRAQARTAALPLGLFGASTGAAAALRFAARAGAAIGAVVSRGGRPDLAGPATLAAVGAPTLLIVGGEDMEVLALNRQALATLRCEKQLEIVPGATHLFEEPGKLDAVAHLACGWFARHLRAP